MPLNEIPKYIDPDTRVLIDSALEQAWQELRRESASEIPKARWKLAGTIVALTLVGETDPDKLKDFALNAARGMARRMSQEGQGT